MTAVLPKHVRSHIVVMEGQHSPLSPALQASEISTAFAVGGIGSGQQAFKTALLTRTCSLKNIHG